MGGDGGVAVTVAAVIDFMRDYPSIEVQLFVSEGALGGYLNTPALRSVADRMSSVICGPQVENDDKPSVAVRSKIQSSMAQAIAAVASGDADACVSAGNTGALMALGMKLLKTIPGVSRPAICGSVPTLKGTSLVLDLGANMDCSAVQLHQFAHLGSCNAQRLNGVEKPRVKLLNVGSEVNKGPQFIQDAAQLLSRDEGLNYCGYIEADQLFVGDADVIVCDGMSGNVALKASEGAAALIGDVYRAEIQRNWLSRLSAALAVRSDAGVSERVNPARYNGACLLGLRGVVIKSHGSATRDAFYQALNIARHAKSQSLPLDLESLITL